MLLSTFPSANDMAASAPPCFANDASLTLAQLGRTRSLFAGLRSWPCSLAKPGSSFAMAKPPTGEPNWRHGEATVAKQQEQSLRSL